MKMSFLFVRVNPHRPKKRLEATHTKAQAWGFFKGEKKSSGGGGAKRRGRACNTLLLSHLTRLRHVVALAHCLLW
jgi:hypothetical protein